MAVGPGALSKDGARVPMGVSQGDRVLIPQVSSSFIRGWQMWMLCVQGLVVQIQIISCLQLIASYEMKWLTFS
jgi:hypothetical protein